MGMNREEVFQQLFQLYYHAIFGFFSKRGFDSEECQDLTQETFLRVYKGMDSYRQEAQIKTWLFTIAGNIYRNELRSRGTEKRSGEEVSLEHALEHGRPIFADNPAAGAGAAGKGPLDSLLAEERDGLLRTALEDLPPRMRRCVLLRLDQGLKYREIAVILHVSVDTVKAQIFQARQRLFEVLGVHFTGFEF